MLLFVDVRVCGAPNNKSVGITISSFGPPSFLRLGSGTLLDANMVIILLGLWGLEHTSHLTWKVHCDMIPFMCVESNSQQLQIGLDTCKWGHVIMTRVK